MPSKTRMNLVVKLFRKEHNPAQTEPYMNILQNEVYSRPGKGPEQSPIGNCPHVRMQLKEK
jgi:hypothetical protein